MSPRAITAMTNAARQLQAALPDDLRHTTFRASDLLSRRRAEIREDPLPTSLPSIDRLLDGGLPRGGLVELVGRGSCGRFSALLAALRAVTGAGETAALVDQGQHLDPQAAAGIGIDLTRLLWLRPRRLTDALTAAELLVHTGFTLIALDTGLPPVRGRASLATWLRLARLADAHRATVLVGTPYRMCGCAANAVLAGGRGRGLWAGIGESTRLLEGLQSHLQLTRRTGYPGCDGDLAVFTLPEAATVQPAVSRHHSTTEERREKHVSVL